MIKALVFPIFAFTVAGWNGSTADFERLLEKGQAALAVGHVDEAQQAFEEAKKHQPRDARGYVAAGRALIAKGDELPADTDEQWKVAEESYRKAEDEIRKAIDLDAGSQDAWMALGKVLLRMGRVFESIDSLYHAQSLGSVSPEILIDLSDAVMEARAAAVNSGNFSEAESRLEEAIEVLEKAEESLRVHGQVLERLGVALREKGELHRALAMYRRAIALHPQVEALHEDHIQVVERLPEDGKLTEIEHCVQFYHGLVEEPALSAWYEARSRTLKGHFVYNKVHDYPLAAEEYRHAELLLRESTKLNTNYVSSAEQWLPALRTYRGHALLNAGRLEEAESAFMSALDRKTGYEPSLKGLSNLLDKYWQEMGGENATKEQFEKIRAFASRVCIANPSDFVTWNNYGFFAREAQQYEESYQAYRRAMSLAPDNARILNDTALILIYHLHRDLDRAEEWLQESLGLAQERILNGENTEDNTLTFGDAMVNMIVLKDSVGEPEEAGRWFRRVEQELPDREEIPTWRQRLFPAEAEMLAKQASEEPAAEPSGSDEPIVEEGVEETDTAPVGTNGNEDGSAEKTDGGNG